MKTRRSIKILLGGLAFCLCLHSNTIAAPNDRPEAMIAEELSTLSKSIDRLTEQMATQAESTRKDTTLRKLDVAIAYLNFRSRRIEMFERDLQSARTGRNRLDDVLEQLQREEENLSQTYNNQNDTMQRAHEDLKFRRLAVKDRINRMGEEIILLENRIMDMQSQIDSVESFVSRNLEL